MGTELCSKCQSMLEIVNEETPGWGFGDVHGETGWVTVPMFQRRCHFSFPEISSAASAGCVLCSKLQAWLLKHGTIAKYKGLDFSAEPNASPGVWKFRFDVSEDDGEHLSNPEPSTRLIFTCHPLDNSTAHTNSVRSELYQGYGKGESKLSNTGNAEVLDHVKFWLQDCLDNHPTCKGNLDPAVYPPRLLDVTNPKVILVSDTTNMVGTPYAALSHCWGPNPKHLILTTDNQSRMRECIKDEELHPTFRHAVEICRMLNIGYLWIDSLCIIQAGGEHTQDWLGHAAIMGSIYQNCVLNIGASFGVDASAGCFVTRNPVEIAPCVVELRKITGIKGVDGEETTVQRDLTPTRHLIVPEPLLTENVGHFHLDTRVWILQERLLSPRTIHFARDQLFWECSGSQNVCETVPEGIWNAQLPKPDEFPYSGEAIGVGFSWGTMEFGEKIPPYTWKAPDPKGQYEWWLKTLRGYVQRKLTKSSDKLPAIGGIAERTSAVLEDEYLAGLFRSHLPNALLWSCVQERRPKMARDPNDFCAPSWSWASSNNNLDFTPLEESECRQLCTVLGSQIKLVDPKNPYGQVSYAALDLRGPFLSFQRKLLDDPENWAYHFAILRLKGFAGKKQLLYFDFDPCTLSCSTLSLLIIRENSRPQTYPGSGNMEEAGLILAPDPANRKEYFVRVGVFKGVEYEEEDRKEEYPVYQQVTIV